MLAWVVSGVGQMHLAEVDDVGEVGPQQVAIRVRVVQPSVAEASAHLTGKWRHATRVEALWRTGPIRLFGHEFCGDVVAIGGQVAGLAVGDRVASIEPATTSGQIGLDLPGAFAEYLVVDAEGIVPVPPSVDDQAAATVQPACYAANTVAAAGQLGGASVIVFGQGAIGLPITQLARRAGAGRVVAVARRREAREAARLAGADVVLDALSVDFDAELAEVARTGIDVAFDAASGPTAAGLSGTDTLHRALSSVRTEGTVVVGAALGQELVDLQMMQRKALALRFPSQQVTAAIAASVVEMLADPGNDTRVLHGPLLEGIETVETAFAMAVDKRQYGIAMVPQVRIWNGS